MRAKLTKHELNQRGRVVGGLKMTKGFGFNDEVEYGVSTVSFELVKLRMKKQMTDKKLLIPKYKKCLQAPMKN